MIKNKPDYSSYFYYSPLPSWVYDLDSFQILDVNQAAIDQYGFSKKEFLNLTLKKLCPESEFLKFVEVHKEIDIKEDNIAFGTFTHQKKNAEFFRTDINGHVIDISGNKCVLVIGQVRKDKNQIQLIQQKTKDLINASLEVISSIDENGKFIKVSAASMKHWGYLPEELEGKNYLTLIHPEDIEKTIQAIAEMIAGKNTTTFEIRCIKKNGEIVNYIWSAQYDSHTNILYAVARIDTVKKENEQLLIESDSRFKSLVQEGLDLIAILDAEGKYIYVSPTTKNVLGIDAEEFIGKSPFEYIHSEDAEKTLESLNSIATEKRVEVTPFRFKNGNGKWRWIKTILTNMLDHPYINGIVANSRDITDQIEEQNRLKLLESVITNTHDAIMITEADPVDQPGPRILYVNEAFTKMTGYTAEEVVGKTPRILQGPNSDQAELARLKKALQNRESCEITTINYKKNGEEFWINFSVSPVANENGFITHFISIERDVTEQKQKDLEKELFNKISMAFNFENKLNIAASKVCRTVCEFGKFDLVEIWTVNVEQNQLILFTHYLMDTGDVKLYEPSFNINTFQISEGLPGKVWASQTQQLWTDIETNVGFIRKDFANILKFKAVMGIPMIFNNKVVGVLLIATKQDAGHLKKYTKIFQQFEGFIGSEINRKKLENDLSHLYHTIPDILCLLDFQGRFLRINKAGCELLSYPEEEILFHSFDEFVHPEDKDISRSEFLKWVEGQSTFKFENRYLTKSGDIVWLSWTCNSAAQDRVIYATAKNITEETKLRELKRQTNKLAKIGSWEIDLIRGKLYWSDMVHELHETDSKYFVPEVKTAINFYREDFRPMVQNIIENCVRTGDAFDFEAVLVTSQKKERWVRAIGNSNLVDGECKRIYGSFQDIHDRKEVEIRLQSLADNLPGVVFQYFLYPDGSESLKNVTKGAQEVWGFSPEAVSENIHLVWNQIKAGGNYDLVEENILASIQTRSNFRARWKYILPNGETQYHMGNASPNFLADGTVFFNSVILDITRETKNEELLEQATQLAKIGSWELTLLNQDGDTMYWSPMTKQILEVDEHYDPSLTKGFEFYTNDSKLRIQEVVDVLIKKGKDFDEELHLITAAGNAKWVRCIGKSERIKGRCVKIYGSFQDIDASKLMELQIREILGSISDAFFALDKNWNFTYFNREAENFLLKKESEVLARNIWHIFPDAIGTQLETIFKSVAATGEPEHFEYLFPGDGNWYEVNAYPSNGGVSAYFTNINERKLAAEKLEKAYQEKNSIIESIGDAFFTMDKNFIVSYWNRVAEELIGVKREQLIGKNLWDIFPEAISLPSYTNYCKVLDTGKAMTFEDNYGKWLEVNAYPSEEGLTVFFRDISLRKEADQRLLKAFEEKNNILESIGDAFFSVTDNWIVTYWNKEAEFLLGKKRDAIVGKHLWEEYADAIDSDFYRQYHKAMETQQNVTFEEHYPTLGKWFEVSVYPTLNSLSVYFKDVTLRKEADLRLVKLNREKKRILERITEAFVSLDANWCCTYMNKQAGEIFNRDPETIIGKHIWTEFPEGINQPFHHTYEKAMATQEYIYLEEHYKPYNKWFENHIYPSPDGISIFFRDVTDKKLAVQKILQANERFEKVTEATNDAIWEWDMFNDNFYWGGGFKSLFGYDVDKTIPTVLSWTDHIHPDDSAEVQASLFQFVNSTKQETWKKEYRYLRADGTFAFVINKGIVMRNEDGKAFRMLGAITDISEHKKHEKTLLEVNESLNKYAHQLELTNEELEQFAFIASHDLQEPLRMISSFLDQLKRKYGNQLDDKAHKYIHFAIDGAKRMKQIILDLLEYSRAGKFTHSAELVDLNEVVEQYILLRRKIINEKKAVINVDKLPLVTSYKSPLTQTLHCLLDNAIKYIRKNQAPQVTITMEELPDSWLVKIADNGIGIESEFHEKIFVIFQRLHNKEEYAGTGIGLSIVKKHVESWGGKIWLESEPGLGSIFYFTHPKKLINNN